MQSEGHQLPYAMPSQAVPCCQRLIWSPAMCNADQRAVSTVEAATDFMHFAQQVS